VERAWARCAVDRQVLTVGFNRRFAPLALRLRLLTKAVTEPKCIVYTISAGRIPASHWTQQAEVGGGRIVGEACHFIDFLRWLTDSPIVGWQVAAVSGPERAREDCASLTFSFADGSIGSVHYF